jgi:hypothetical protein
MRASWGKTGDVLERLADAFDEVPKDRAKVESLQVEEGKVNVERGERPAAAEGIARARGAT